MVNASLQLLCEIIKNEVNKPKNFCQLFSQKLAMLLSVRKSVIPLELIFDIY